MIRNRLPWMEASEVKNMELCFIFCNGSKRSEGFAERSGREILRMMNFPD
ncbi:hypothetical protein [Limisalsivibrio acetivorans]|nr:hypothetical protein [Limisalsivibrio acetivorans]